MSKRSILVSPTLIDAGEAQTAFDAELPELEELGPHELVTPRVDLQQTSALAYAVAMRDLVTSRRDRLEALGRVFDIAVLERIPMRALAVFHARSKQSEAIDAVSLARVSESMLREAQASRWRMLRVLSYFFEDHLNYAAQLAVIGSGTGCLALAHDLLALAELYEEPEIRALIASDPKHYRRDDPRQAEGLAQQLLRALGLASGGAAAQWTDLAGRAWTLLSRDYSDLRAAGQLVFRNDEDVQCSYPPLASAFGAAATRSHHGEEVAALLETAPARS